MSQQFIIYIYALHLYIFRVWFLQVFFLYKYILLFVSGSFLCFWVVFCLAAVVHRLTLTVYLHMWTFGVQYTSFCATIIYSLCNQWKTTLFYTTHFCAGNLNFGRFVNCQLNIYLCYADTKDTTKLNNMKVQKTMSTFAHHWFSVSLSRLSSVFFYMCSPCFISIVKYLLNRLMLTK